jgi:predicted nucleic acid-binding protein
VLHTYDVLPFDADVAEFYGGLVANIVHQAGCKPRPRRIDLLVAAAVRHGYSLATRNGADLRHLERVLTVIDVG